MVVQETATQAATPAATPSTETSSQPTETTGEEKSATSAGVSEPDEVSEDVSAATEENPTKKEIAKFKRKINGKDVEATEEELWKHYGLEVTARERMEEASKIKKESEQQADALAKFLSAVKENPRTAFHLLEEMGHDTKKIAREIVMEQLEYDRMTPEQKELHDLKKWRKEQEEKETVRKQEEETYQEKMVRDKFTTDIDSTLSETFKLSGMQPKPKTIARMAEACQTLMNASKTGDLPTPDQILKKFLAIQRQDLSEMIGEQDLDKLAELGLISDTLAERITKWRLDKNKANLPSFSGSSRKAASDSPKKAEPVKKIGLNEFFNNLGK